jgi:Papain fold toxin 2
MLLCFEICMHKNISLIMKTKYLVKLFLTTCLSLVVIAPIVEMRIPWIGRSSAVAQVTTDTFKNDAFAATSKYNNKNLVCKEYARTLYDFVKVNAAKYKLGSYKVYQIKVPLNPGRIFHDDYSATDPISTNGIHYLLLIDGYVFDNHHPKGKLQKEFNAGLVVPTAPAITEILDSAMQNIQC